VNHRIAIPLLLATCWALAAEDQPVPPPPPAADPTAPVPPPPPTADPTVTTPRAEAPPAPVRTPPAGAPRGNRAAAAAGRAAQERPDPLSLRAQLDAGYDSNVLREDSSTPTATETSGPAIGAELHGTWRAVREPKAQLNLIGDVRYNTYPDESDADLGRVGVAAFGLLRMGWVVDPGAVVGVNRQWIDGEGIATILRGTVTATRLNRERDHFDTLSLDFYDVSYDDNDAASGVLSDLLWRHWWLPEAGNARKRVEVTLMAGRYSAEAEVESYTTVKPGVGARYRLGDWDDTAGIWDLSGSANLEWRRYDEATAGSDEERQLIWQAGAAADRWFTSWLAAGPFISFSLRDSNRDGRDYDRVQVGARLIADW
jgi:hypothetical protein